MQADYELTFHVMQSKHDTGCVCVWDMRCSVFTRYSSITDFSTRLV